MYALERVRILDASAQPELARRVRERGPFQGHCPSCGRSAEAIAPWVEVDMRGRTAVLVLPEHHRGDVVDALARHLEIMRRHPELCLPFLLQPEIRTALSETTARRAMPGAQPDAVPTHSSTQPMQVPEPRHRSARSGEASVRTGDPPRRNAEAAREDLERSTGRSEASRPVLLRAEPQPVKSERSRPPGVPQPIGSDGLGPGLEPARPIGSEIGELTIEAGIVRLRAPVDPERLATWKSAKLEVRPIHVRGRGYPLLGVRIVAAYMGQLGCIDGLVDVGLPVAIDVFRALAQRFAIELWFAPAGAEPVVRNVAALGLEANAALCLESARGALAQGDHPPAQFLAARARLGQESVEERLSPTKVTIAPGAYLHIVGAREAMRALEHLDRVSRKETLARLLEVEGLPMGEYDAIRRRVLAGSLEHGIVAPRRFWRRVIASGLAEDLADYVARLARNRQVHEGEEGDLEGEQARSAWEAIHDVCLRKDIACPPELRLALDLPESAPTRQSTAPAPAAGVIDIQDDHERPSLQARLADHRTRLKAATELLQDTRVGPEELGHLFDALDSFDNDELLAILPDLSDLGPRAVAGLVAKLRSDRRELRQAAAILLGLSLDPDALGPLSDLLVQEPTNVWLDVARALGAFGPIALRRLCQVLRREASTGREHIAIERVGRAFAEIALSDGLGAPVGARPGHDAVAALADAPDPRVSTAARRALATLRDVSESGAAIRGELPLTEVTEVRGFSRRAYEAIMVPELEVEAEG
jgi:hypothetical protein